MKRPARMLTPCLEVHELRIVQEDLLAAEHLVRRGRRPEDLGAHDAPLRVVLGDEGRRRRLGRDGLEEVNDGADVAARVAPRDVLQHRVLPALDAHDERHDSERRVAAVVRHEEGLLLLELGALEDDALVEGTLGFARVARGVEGRVEVGGLPVGALAQQREAHLARQLAHALRREHVPLGAGGAAGAIGRHRGEPRDHRVAAVREVHGEVQADHGDVRGVRRGRRAPALAHAVRQLVDQREGLRGMVSCIR
mmetsp:Transcript_15951/g.48695  ORF Transcript_15951/g.48695 Transcript_15951/m.48695 type:complete len:252 (-) Transcript_15951:382-1137(-)